MITKQHNKKQTCRQCGAIRRFLLMATLLIISMPFIGGKVEIFKILTPMRFVYVIGLFGLLAITIKVFEWLKLRSAEK
ncbi:MAG: hypothetical protein ACI9O0_000693 [Paracoccaceae bacterium]|jgi:hypothetical protein